MTNTTLEPTVRVKMNTTAMDNPAETIQEAIDFCRTHWKTMPGSERAGSSWHRKVSNKSDPRTGVLDTEIVFIFRECHTLAMLFKLRYG